LELVDSQSSSLQIVADSAKKKVEGWEATFRLVLQETGVEGTGYDGLEDWERQVSFPSFDLTFLMRWAFQKL